MLSGRRTVAPGPSRASPRRRRSRRSLSRLASTLRWSSGAKPMPGPWSRWCRPTNGKQGESNVVRSRPESSLRHCGYGERRSSGGGTAPWPRPWRRSPGMPSGDRPRSPSTHSGPFGTPRSRARDPRRSIRFETPRAGCSMPGPRWRSWATVSIASWPEPERRPPSRTWPPTRSSRPTPRLRRPRPSVLAPSGTAPY